ncbi:hypothetical protein [Arthrobacter sp.]|uniref:hypothetical protein n=1 Tax=Arthrobacter sp. TaxID=1667 RepID=UPI0028127281|nr:hypothetical protein [Arthrobacter sp.]
MTELNQPPNPVAQARWPQARRLQASPDQGINDAGTTDQDVDEALGLLSQLPDLAVAEHGVVYAELHDVLLEALNAEVLDADPQSPSDARLP